MKNFVALFAFLICATASSQIQFEKGYFVTISGERVNCLIKNSDWVYNPESFDYKLSKNTEVKTAELKEIQEFKVNEFYFINESAKIEMSSEKTSDLSSDRSPDFTVKNVFLRLLIDGEVDFYEYVSRNKVNFFYRKDGEKLEPLIQKKYRVNSKIKENLRYRQQLISDLKCNDRNFDVTDIAYSRRDLMGYVQNLNKCLGSDSDIYFNSQKNSKWVLYPVVGLGLANLEVDKGLGAGGTSLSGLEYSVGLELEYIFNFNKYKWSTAIETTYRGFQDEQLIENAGYKSDLRVRYNSVSTFLALRHYFYLSEKSKLFVHIGPIVDVPVGSEILYANTGRAMDPVLNELDTNFGLGLGIGYTVSDKLSIGVDYTSKNIAGEKFVEANYDLDWKSSYSSFSLKLEYAIF